jgi:hypothetical protein
MIYQETENALIRIQLTGTNNSDEMVSKQRVHFRDIVFGHMATAAVRCCFRADRRGTGRSSGYIFMPGVLSQAMATQTLLIIEAGVPNQRLMRVVTSNACQSNILRCQPAAALLQAIRLKADTAGPERTCMQNDIRRGFMTGPAEIDGACWREMGRVQNGLARLVYLTSLDGTYMVDSWPMAGFAMDSRYGICARSVSEIDSLVR